MAPLGITKTEAEIALDRMGLITEQDVGTAVFNVDVHRSGASWRMVLYIDKESTIKTMMRRTQQKLKETYGVTVLTVARMRLTVEGVLVQSYRYVKDLFFGIGSVHMELVFLVPPS